MKEVYIQQTKKIVAKSKLTNKYLKKSLPPAEFEYSKAEISTKIEILKDERKLDIRIHL